MNKFKNWMKMTGLYLAFVAVCCFIVKIVFHMEPEYVPLAVLICPILAFIETKWTFREPTK